MERSLFAALAQLPKRPQGSLPDDLTRSFQVEVGRWSFSLRFCYTEGEGDLYLELESIAHPEFGVLQPDHNRELFLRVERLLDERLSLVE